MLEVLASLRDAEWLTGERCLGWARVLLAFELIAFAFFVAGTHGWITPLARPSSSDFVSFYAAGHLANTAAPWDVYNHSAHYAAEQAATQPGISYNYFYYPPVFLLLCGLLARLPYLVAFCLFQALTLAPCLAALRAILPRAPATVLLAYPAVFWTLGTGQNAFLSAALLAGATLQSARRPVLAGILFGALCYKPDLGLLVPLALAAGRQWRCFAAATGTVIALVLLSIGAYGWTTWQAFLQAALGAGTVYAGTVDIAGYTSPFGLLRSLGCGTLPAALAQAAALLCAAAMVWTVWRRDAPLPLRAAVLLAATPVAVPMAMFYDLMLTGVAMAWLVAHGLKAGFPPGGKVMLALLFWLPLLSGNLRHGSHFPDAALVAGSGLLLAGTVAGRELPGDPNQARRRAFRRLAGAR